MTGHLLGAAGAIEAIASIMAIKNDIVPPTINHQTADDQLDPKINFTFGKPKKERLKLHCQHIWFWRPQCLRFSKST